MCKFNDVLRDGGGEFVYDVHWYINEESVVLHTGISFSNIGRTNLTESDWVGNYTLNMVVSLKDIKLKKNHQIQILRDDCRIYVMYSLIIHMDDL